MTHDETLAEIARLIGRPITFYQVTITKDNAPLTGYVGEYFNFMAAHDITSRTISDTQEEAATKLLAYLQEHLEKAD